VVLDRSYIRKLLKLFPPYHFSKKWCKTTFAEGYAKQLNVDFGSTFSKGGKGGKGGL